MDPESIKAKRKNFIKVLLVIVISLKGLNCNSQKRDVFKSGKVYESSTLIITQSTENTFVHTSFKQTNDFGNVPCNGLVVRSNSEVIIFDTPTNDESSKELIKWLEQTLRCKVKAVIPTHFHDDCLGGLKAFHESNIRSYAYFKTIEFAVKNNYTIPENSFKDSLVLKVGNERIIAKFFGEGHTKDNIVCYFPSERILFGGCLIKELGANKGYLGDANVSDWSDTVERIKEEYSDVKIVVPGHGKFGGKKLLDYTINLFKLK